jgi:hypothetical protein
MTLENQVAKIPVILFFAFIILEGLLNAFSYVIGDIIFIGLLLAIPAFIYILINA